MAFAGLIFAKHIGKKVQSIDDNISATYEELVAGFGKLPGGFMSVAPIIMPILFMALGSISAMAKWTGAISDLLKFLGTPIIALAVGTLFGVWLLSAQKKTDKFYEITNDTLKVVGPILFITAAGGVLGRVIASSGLVTFISDNAAGLSAVGILFPFLLSAILKTAQGSSTVALTTTSSILFPLMGTLGLDKPILGAITVMAIAAGALTVSHANDSYFWVVTNFGGINVKDGYKTQTLMTLTIGIAAMIGITILYMIFR